MVPKYNPDHLRNSKWISWIDLARRWKIRDFELIEKLRAGLQPYSENGVPLNCPLRFHVHRRLSDEYSVIVRQLRDLGKVPLKDTKRKRQESSFREGTKNELEDQKEKILAEMGKVEKADQAWSSWKFFELPQLEADFDEFMQDMKSKIFRLEEIMEFERTAGVGLEIQPRAEAMGPTTSGEGPKRPRYSHFCRMKCREIAKRLWQEDEWIPLTSMLDRPEFSEYARKKNKRPYIEKTFLDWIRNLCPHPKRGRPPEPKD